MMAPLIRRLAIDITAHHPDDPQTLTDRIGREPDAKARDRLRCVSLAIQGLTAPQIAERVGRSRRFVQRWCYGYRDHGFEGLIPRRQTGRPPKLSSDQEQAFKARVLAGPTDADGVCTLRGRDFVDILEHEFGTSMSLSAVYDLLHRLDLSCLKPRPQHRQSDPQAQAQWVDRAPFLSAKCGKNTPTSASRSGSRMKHALASKAD